MRRMVFGFGFAVAVTPNGLRRFSHRASVFADCVAFARSMGKFKRLRYGAGMKSRGRVVIRLGSGLLALSVVGLNACGPTRMASFPSSSSSIASTQMSDPELQRVSYQSASTHAERDYFVYLPAGYATSKDTLWPVLFVLHGNGERGDAKRELGFLLKNGPLYEAWIQKRQLPFVIVAPQLPMFGQDAYADYLKNRTFDEIPKRLKHGVPARPPRFPTPAVMTGAVAQELPKGSTAYGPPMGWPELESDVISILDSVLKSYRVDPSRQYLTGISYGGFGAWYLASKYPNRFAAIAPVVGFGHPDLMEPIAKAKIPIWVFAGGFDDAVPVQHFYPGLNRLKALGQDFRFTIEEDMSHDVWTRVYEGNDLYDWLLRHKLPRVSTIVGP